MTTGFPALDAPGVQPPLIRSEERVTIRALTGIRAVAAGWVVIGHIFPQVLLILFPGTVYASGIIHSAYLGVDVFFVLSGFILTHTYLMKFSDTSSFSRRKYGHFIWMRLARIYPVHLFCLLVMVAGVVVGSKIGLRFGAPERLTWGDLPWHVLLLQAWGFGHIDGWNGPAWSVSAEWFAYLLFPFACPLIAKVKSHRVAWVLFLLAYVLLLAFFSGNSPPFAPTFASGADRPLVRIAMEFFAGCMLYRIYQSGSAPSIKWTPIIAFLTLAAMIFLQLFPPHEDISLLITPMMALLVLGLACSKGGFAKLLGTATFVFWGEASYSLYMTHDVVLKVLIKCLPAIKYENASLVVRVGVLAVHFIAVGLFAACTYKFIETPARRLMRKWIGERPPIALQKPEPDAKPVSDTVEKTVISVPTAS